MVLQCLGDDRIHPQRQVRTIREAKEVVTALLRVGTRGLTAEVVDEDGEIVAYYDRGWRDVE